MQDVTNKDTLQPTNLNQVTKHRLNKFHDQNCDYLMSQDIL